MTAPYLHIVGGSNDSVYLTSKTLEQVREYFTVHAADALPEGFVLPESFSKLEVWRTTEDTWEVWFWGQLDKEFYFKEEEVDNREGRRVLIDNKKVYNSEEDEEDEED